MVVLNVPCYSGTFDVRPKNSGSTNGLKLTTLLALLYDTITIVPWGGRGIDFWKQIVGAPLCTVPLYFPFQNRRDVTAVT